MIKLKSKMNLEQVIGIQFDQSVIQTCPGCEQDIPFERCGDPIGDITDAVWEYLLTPAGYSEYLERKEEK